MDSLWREELVGLVGIVVFFAGLHLVWQSRDAALFWMRRFLLTFRRALRESSGMDARGAAKQSAEAAEPPAPGLRGRALKMAGGLGLVILGQLLFLLGMVLVLTD